MNYLAGLSGESAFYNALRAKEDEPIEDDPYAIARDIAQGRKKKK